MQRSFGSSTRAVSAIPRASCSALSCLTPPIPHLTHHRRSFSSKRSNQASLDRSATSTPFRRSISTINPSEISHFAALASTWWDEAGDFNLLQRMNKVRVEFMRERMLETDGLAGKESGYRFLEGKRVLDVGCGGGLFAERLARLGASTLAIDASNENVQTATLHASQDPQLLGLLSSGALEYRHCAAEDLVPNAESEQTEGGKEQFDVVCAMEVIEHVSDPPAFLRCIADLTKPGGHIILSTISRTPLSKLLTIQLAESSLLRFAPPGSHTYEQYIKPSELTSFFVNELGWGTQRPQGAPAGHLTPDQRSLRYAMEVRGTTYLPWKGEWTLFGKDEGDNATGLVGQLSKSCNYFFGAKKPL